MPTAHERPTLLVFTRGAEHETRRRRLLPARLAALELAVHRRCVATTLAAGRAAGCAITVCSPAPFDGAPGVRRLAQRGGAFGSRLRAALRQARAGAAGPLLVVGTDTPGLSAGHLRAAIERLEREPRSVVVGPAPDGGLYLLATRRPLDRLLAGIAWQRRETVDLLLAALAAAGIPVSLLEPLADLDRPQDLARWASRGGDLTDPWRPLLARVRRALAALARFAVPAVLGRLRRPELALPDGRAPPLAL